MSEQLPVLCYTTVAGGGYTAGSGLLNVASTGAGSGALPFPGVAEFSIAIADPTTFVVKALLKVTAVNSSTQWAVTNSGGVDANCVSGDLVQGVIDGRALAAMLAGGGSWTAMPYQNGYVDWITGGYQIGQYKLSGSRVYWRGVARVPSGLGAGAAIAAMPIGFRPIALQSIPIMCSKSGATDGYGHAQVDIQTGGTCVVQGASPQVGGAVWLDLSYTID